MLILSQLMDMDTDYSIKTISDNPMKIIENIDIHKDSIIEGVQIIKD